jgi:hypothetical protein
MMNIAAEIKVEPADDGYRIAVYLEGHLSNVINGFDTEDAAMSAARDLVRMLLDLPGVQEHKLQ